MLKLVSKENTIVRVGRTLAAERNRQGKTIEMISSLTGLSKQIISNAENGVIKNPRFELVRYGSVLGYTPDQLATLYGFWEPSYKVEDVRLSRLKELIDQLPEAERESTLEFIDNYVATVQRSVNEKGA
jgi:transcriptional regulator with XRE-family HTH domain